MLSDSLRTALALAGLGVVPVDPPGVQHLPGAHRCHLPTSSPSPAESHKPGFVPPRDLSKHSPLIKSQSLVSIRRVRSREDGTDAEPGRAPSPSPSPRPGRERRNVQRAQSVPAQNKAARRLRKQSSAEQVAGTQGEDPPGVSGPRDATVRQPPPRDGGDASRAAAPRGGFGEGSRGSFGRGGDRTRLWGPVGDNGAVGSLWGQLGSLWGQLGSLWGRQGHGERLW